MQGDRNLFEDFRLDPAARDQPPNPAEVHMHLCSQQIDVCTMQQPLCLA